MAASPDIFISYNREDQASARRFADAFEAAGLSVWWDVGLRSGEAYDEVTETALRTARAVVVLWSKKSVGSRWVRAEATLADRNKTLVPCMIEACERPIMFELTQTADLSHWQGAPDDKAWSAFLTDVKRFVAKRSAAAQPPAAKAPDAPVRPTVLVLPFINMSNEPEQEYFSDGISEDIITDLGRVSALSVVSRNAAFALKGKNVEDAKAAREEKLTHILSGSVRKSGNRVRITAQLIDAKSDEHLWAERWDRDLNDIFALQDELSKAIVAALKLKLLPQEKSAIERRDTNNTEAYQIYLLARQFANAGNMNSVAGCEKVAKLCKRAISLDPNYARAWGLLSVAQRTVIYVGGEGEDGLAAAEKALSIDPSVAEAYAARISDLAARGDLDGARKAIETALKIDPDCFDVHVEAGRIALREGRYQDAIRHFESIAALVETSFVSVGMLVSCYLAVGDMDGVRSAAERTVARAEKALAAEMDHGTALGFGVGALAHLGQMDRAREWAARAMIVDPDNWNMHYNIACAFIVDMHAYEDGLDILERTIPAFSRARLIDMKTDPDFAPVRDHPRFLKIISDIEARVGAT